MQVICSGFAKCKLPCEDGHNVPHMQCQACPVTCYGGAVCIPVQSDFERGQEEMRVIKERERWQPYVLMYTLQDGVAHVPQWSGIPYYAEAYFDSTSEKMPKGICRNCGHPKYTHYHWDGTCDYCDCKKFLPAEPLAPEKKDVSLVDVLTYDAGYEAGKADCAKTHEALRNEGRREVVEWVDLEIRVRATYSDPDGHLQAIRRRLRDKKEEWGL